MQLQSRCKAWHGITALLRVVCQGVLYARGLGFRISGLGFRAPTIIKSNAEGRFPCANGQAQ